MSPSHSVGSTIRGSVDPSQSTCLSVSICIIQSCPVPSVSRSVGPSVRQFPCRPDQSVGSLVRQIGPSVRRFVGPSNRSVGPSVRRSVGPSVRRSVGPSVRRSVRPPVSQHSYRPFVVSFPRSCLIWSRNATDVKYRPY